MKLQIHALEFNKKLYFTSKYLYEIAKWQKKVNL
jgi:hypothetical protein